MRFMNPPTMRIAPVLMTALSSLLMCASVRAGGPEWVDGDFFVRAQSVGGDIQVFSSSGVLKETIPGLAAIYLEGAIAFGPNAGDLYSPVSGETFEEDAFSTFDVYDHAHPHTRTTLIPGQAGGKSIQFDAQGNFYIRGVIKFSAAGVLLDAFQVAGAEEHLRLAPDQRTLFYTTGSGGIRRFDVVTHTQLTNFSTDGDAEFFLLPPFDGTGGAIAADVGDIKRFDANGALIQTYDLPGVTQWLYVQPDRNGTSFWAEGNGAPVNLHRFNIATGVEDAPPILLNDTVAGGFIIKGAPQGGTTPPRFDAPTPCDTVVMGSVGVPMSFTVQASDINDGDTVSLFHGGIPLGASVTPSVPANGNPVSITFHWTPTGAQTGTIPIHFFATDVVGHATTCTATVIIDGPGEPYCFGDQHDPVVTALCPCSNFGDDGHGCGNSVFPSGAQLSATGTKSPNTVVFLMTNVPNNTLATGFRNTTNTIPGGVVFGDGIRCQSGVLIRFSPHNTGTLGDAPSTWSSNTDTITPGLTRYYQVQYRNSAPFCTSATFNISNGYRISW